MRISISVAAKVDRLPLTVEAPKASDSGNPEGNRGQAARLYGVAVR